MNLEFKHKVLLLSVLNEYMDTLHKKSSSAMSHKDATLKEYEDMVDKLKELRYIRETLEGEINV